ncbi:hypothetical protein HMPREF1982_00777 [Clostridiales bacterium oral taxon 876 str. F0540]|nr:hypothetical protein HMPREF1982_00777 [Clostridiales bacterium oral taxon 876 str. F0540]
MQREIKASPTKDFFIHMITRDIDLKDAILELVDNSIDGAKRLRKDARFDGLEIQILINENNFSISDNCGGIPVEIAEKYAFRFGRPADAENKVEYSTGVFGIGMKRALFKLGSYFQVMSKTIDSEFLIQFDIDTWRKDDEKWDIYFTQLNEMCAYDISNTGTTISVDKLYPGISEKFKIHNFISELKEHIQNRVGWAIERGIKIIINGVPMDFSQSQIFCSDDLKPVVEIFTIDGIEVKIIAGIGETGKPNEAGWYIYSNGRLLLSADKTNITGWGEDGIRQFHPTFARFRGYVFFQSNNLEKLPWNTTKTGVDSSSSIYIYAKMKMKSAARPIFEFLVALKNQDSEENKSESEIDNLTLVNVENLQVNNQFIIGTNFKRIIENPSVRISYNKPREEVEAIKEKLKISANSEVGRKTFEYFLKMECD